MLLRAASGVLPVLWSQKLYWVLLLVCRLSHCFVGFTKYVKTLYRIHQSSFIGEMHGVMISSMGPMECPFSGRCWANLDMPYPYLKSRRRSRKRVLNDLPVCPVYFMLQVGQMIL